jgi:ABC-2 type transport system permease protein
MNSILLIARRDLGAYLNGLTGYVIVAAVLFLNGLAFESFSLARGSQYSHEVLEQFFFWTFGFTVTVALLLTMRSIAEERQQGTDVLLHTAPVTDGQIVVGKYVAAMGVLGVFLALTSYMPALILVNGKISAAHVAVGYLGLTAAASAAASIGIFASSLFRNQVASVIVGGVITITFTLCWLLSDVVEAPFTDLVAYMALFDKHFVPFQKGRLLTTGLTFYGSLTFLFLLLTSRVLEGRRSQ